MREDHYELYSDPRLRPDRQKKIIPDRWGRGDARKLPNEKEEPMTIENQSSNISGEAPVKGRWPIEKKRIRDLLEKVAKADVSGLLKAQDHYGDSWKRRGGVGAFMMLARKWDRLENCVSGKPTTEGDCYDIFEHLRLDRRAEGLIDTVRDLRRYLMLVEAEMMARGVVHDPGRDNHDDKNDWALHITSVPADQTFITQVCCGHAAFPKSPEPRGFDPEEDVP